MSRLLTVGGQKCASKSERRLGASALRRPCTSARAAPSAYQSRCCGEGVSRVPTCKILSRGHLRKCLQTQRYTVKFMLTVIREPCSSLQNIVQPATTWQAPQLHSKVGWRKNSPPATQRGVPAISDIFTCKICPHTVVPPRLGLRLGESVPFL